MPTYLTLLRFTQKGIEGIKEGPARLDAAKEAYRSAGAKLREFYLVTGKYDAVVLAEAPGDELPDAAGRRHALARRRRCTLEGASRGGTRANGTTAGPRRGQRLE